MKSIKKTIVIVLVLLLSFSLYAVTFSKSLLSVNSDAHLLSNSGNEPPNDTYWEVMIPGVGYELIYILTDSENTPDTPTGDNPSG